MAGCMAWGPDRPQRAVLAERPAAVLDHDVRTGGASPRLGWRGGQHAVDLTGGHSPAYLPGPVGRGEGGPRGEPADGLRVRLVHAYPGARGLPDPVRETEVVGVEVRDEDRRDVSDLVPGFADPCHQAVPRFSV